MIFEELDSRGHCKPFSYVLAISQKAHLKALSGQDLGD